ncbi:sulfatase-like hydrolase/transferase [Neolewinella aurantiaca]|uniref:Sulfatase-like hydrolase/transferase n=1 Tax=Neolewinella aurantiaca TaxID=2602767 RepID=A0A5C7FVH3_9BACT|nr:sulfatase-like hydrolase/transferase [Neolewinella aurantiaca]TXF90322.1 sulfatase-like hydrolase/transferase [Neolewinella aurantiaca]
MTRVFSLLFFATGMLSAQSQPNILLVIADDLGVDPLNGYHEAGLKASTPVLDSLRSAGITFTNATASPVCSPTRAAIMSGQYGVKNGVLSVPGDLADTEQTLFKSLAAATNGAYADALIGKWHLTFPLRVNDPLNYGPDIFDGFLRGAPDEYTAWNRVQNGETTQSDEYVTTALTDAALGWINEQTQPWFLWLAHAAPHSPYHVPPEGMYTVENPTSNLRKYIAMIEALDFEVGRMLSSLEPEVAENTLIIFVGDNGTPNNILQDYPGGHGKGTLYQGGVRVPLIVSGKGVTRTGEREDALVHVTDIHATILEAAGSQVQGGVFNSLSFHHLLSDEAEARPVRDYNYVEVQNEEARHSGWAIRDDRYKLINFDDDVQEFYDLATDSLELENLLNAGLSASEQATMNDLEAEASVIRSGWSCRDHIMNGDETGIDCGTTACGTCTTSTTSFSNGTDLLLYPNPATDYLVVDALGEKIGSVRIFNQQGQILQQTHGYGMRILEINASQLQPGHYFVEVSTSAGESRLVHTVVIVPSH